MHAHFIRCKTAINTDNCVSVVGFYTNKEERKGIVGGFVRSIKE